MLNAISPLIRREREDDNLGHANVTVTNIIEHVIQRYGALDSNSSTTATRFCFLKHRYVFIRMSTHGICHQIQMKVDPKSMHNKIEQLKQNCSHTSGAAGAIIHYEVITVYAHRTLKT